MTAGNSSVGSAWGDPEGTFQTNTTGSFNLLEAVRRQAPGGPGHAGLLGRRLRTPGVRRTCRSPKRAPVRPGLALRRFESGRRSARRTVRPRLRPRRGGRRVFNQIGPGQSDAQAPAEFARDIALAEDRGDRKFDLKIGNPESERDFTDVRDTARALTGIVAGPATGTFNICSGAGVRSPTSPPDCPPTPRSRSVWRRPRRAHPADVPLVVGSAARLKKATGWQPEIPLWISLLDLLDDWRRRI